MGKSDHHLLGYYIGLQDSVYEVMQYTNERRWPPKLNKELIEKGVQWKLLLQLDSDKTINSNWVDAGKILFFIHEDDLKNKNFDNVFTVIDTT